MSRTERNDRTPGHLEPGGSRARAGAIAATLLLAASAAPLVGATAGGASMSSITTSLSSTSDSQRAKTSFSFRPWVSGDGRYVAFDSDGATLVPGDTNRVRDIFVYDRGNG